MKSGDARPDLSEFTPVKAKAKRSWEKRRAAVAQRFPSVDNLDWKAAFDNDLDLFADIMRDILKADAASPGRSGPKPGVEYREGVERFRQMADQDYSLLPFTEAFKVLQGSMSVTTLARKVGLSRSDVYRLLTGAKRPTDSDIEMIAKAFKKSPGYFHDYRVGRVATAIANKLDEVPEASVRWYRHVREAA